MTDVARLAGMNDIEKNKQPRDPTAEPGFMRPDWVILGVRQHDGTVAVYGSLELSEAELRYERDVIEDRWSDPFVLRVIPGTARYFITAEMKTFAVAVGATYADALKGLFAGWDADGPGAHDSHRAGPFAALERPPES